MQMQRIIQAIYPSQCMGCDAAVADDNGLCGGCWSDTNFLTGLVCDKCGAPLMGEDDGTSVQCDDCMVVARPWARGRAVFAYAGVGRRIVLALKHGDRLDLPKAVAPWMAQRMQVLSLSDPLCVPVPLHPRRLLRRRYNQAALLAQALARRMDATACVDGLLRVRHTRALDGHDRQARFAALDQAIGPNPRRRALIAGRNIILVDDVMTSGATLAAATEALNAAGAETVSVVTLARVVKDA